MRKILLLGNGLEQIYYVAIYTQRFLWFTKGYTCKHSDAMRDRILELADGVCG